MQEDVQEEMQEAGNLEIGSFDSPFRPKSDCQYLDPDGWLKFTYDTGAAITAFPLDAKIGEETEANDMNYKTASGELIPDQGGLKIKALTEAQHPLTMNGRKADVHKVLLSAGRVHSKGHVGYLNGAGGWVIPGGTALAKEMEDLIRKHARRTPGSIALYQERGTYVGYVLG